MDKLSEYLNKRHDEAMAVMHMQCNQCDEYKLISTIKRCQLTGKNVCDDCRDTMCSNENDPSTVECHYCEHFLTL